MPANDKLVVQMAQQIPSSKSPSKNRSVQIVGLFLIALIGGLIGGFVLDYVVYQPQISRIENMTWHQVFSISMNYAGFVSNDFELKGGEVRVQYTTIGNDVSAWISFALFYSNGTELRALVSSGISNSNSGVLDLYKSGSYYLNTTTYLMRAYYVSIWDYY